MIKMKQILDQFEIKIGIFLILYLTCGFNVVNDIIPSIIVIGLWLALFIKYILKITKINKISVIILLYMCTIVLISSILSEDSMQSQLNIVASFIIVWVFSTVYSFKNFNLNFRKVIFFLCICSLIGWIAFYFFPQLKNLFLVKNVAGHYFCNFWLYIHNVLDRKVARNMGIFWEPGAYQTFISLALLFEFSEENINFKRVIVYIITLILTFSTTGYFSLMLIFLYIIVKKTKNNRSKKIIIILVGILFVLLYLKKDILFDTTTYSTFGKLQLHFVESKKISSVSVRVNSIIKPFILIMENPFLGVGNNGLREEMFEYTKGVNTCTFINWYAVYGSVYGTTMVIGIGKLLKKLSNNIFSFLIAFTIMFMTTISENYVNNAFFFMISLYGYKKLYSE